MTPDANGLTFPRWLYHEKHGSRICPNPTEFENAVQQGWQTRPFAQKPASPAAFGPVDPKNIERSEAKKILEDLYVQRDQIKGLLNVEKAAHEETRNQLAEAVTEIKTKAAALSLLTQQHQEAATQVVELQARIAELEKKTPAPAAKK